VTLAEVGGAQTYVRDLLAATRDEFDVSVAAHGDGPLRTAAANLGVPFIPLRHVRRDLSLVQDPLGLLELTRLFRRLRPDIVHLNSSKVGILGRVAAAVAGVPIRVFTAHGWAFKATSGAGASVYLWADRIVRPLTTMVVCVSQTELRAGLAARTCTTGRSMVITNGVDVEGALRRAPEDADGSDRPQGRRVEIISVGRLAEPKDFSTLIAAMARLEPGAARLRVFGEGPLRESLEREIAEQGVADTVELPGEVPDVRPFLAESDIFVLSSRSEGMPLSVLEAMAAALPVVASAVGGLSEVVVDGETGLLIEAGNAEELARALALLAGDRERRERLGALGRQRAEQEYALPRWRTAHLDLYRRLLESKGRARAGANAGRENAD
jgi:glycosyltransferase involved in cell wall biosynthesis